MTALKEQWPWNSGFLALFLIAPSVVGVGLAGAYWSIGGMQALWFLLGIPIGIFMRLLFASAGKKVKRLQDKFADDPGEVIEALLVIGKIESPGLAILRDNELELVPIVGQPVTIPRDKLNIYKEGRMLPGKFVWGKRAFILSPYKLQRIAFAIAESTGYSWSRQLRRT